LTGELSSSHSALVMLLSRVLFSVLAALGLTACSDTVPSPRRESPRVEIRAVYGGIPNEGLSGVSLADLGVNAVFIGSGSVTEDRVEWVRDQGAKIYAEFNTLHRANYLKDHPDAAPVGVDGKISPPPHGWQGICPSHPGYRSERMHAFRKLVSDFQLDGVWLDYHHSHASWEREVPAMPDTCFCQRCLQKFSTDMSLQLPATSEESAELILSEHRPQWTQWRCDLLTDWVKEFRSILDEERPEALLGTFHNPWSDDDYDGARIEKLAIDLKAQAAYIDVFSPMPYHARFGHESDLDWIAEQTSWLGDYLGIEGRGDEKLQIWPIVQVSDWGGEVSASEVSTVIERGTKPPATGVIVFAWGSLKEQSAKVDELWQAFRRLADEK